MKRFLLPLLAALTLGAGGAVTFGGLNVTPRGPQKLNLQTGATELPQGGTATDARTGLRLSAGRMELQPGERLTAREATVTTRQGGTLRAQSVAYDLRSGTVTASGGVTYTDARLRDLRADRLVLHVKTGFVSALGAVQSQTPPLSAAALAFDASTSQAVLAGPYRVSTGGLQAGPGGRLLLVFGGNRLLRVTPNPDAVTVTRFAPYLK
ncbi:hypothetical protein DAETH_13910 [Deinococcus aetherius]|uniref:Organic solvent tolerance-like N-terminal domain-containing protein n=1 Tax=Deinococcus aetherius TaxID=200252 RepID=A0ABM8ACD3_9DEIO|nr:hypothetical protein [Deinococcus aetherius]BDP41422.1 hypothetical protein DAETH_13910 [Deinococcus aetherius]